MATGTAPPAPALRAFALALVIVTQLVLLPSEPYRRGMFEFGLLSWFHFYVAICTAAATALIAWRAYSLRNLAWLAGLCLALAAPFGAQFLGGAGFITGTFSILDQIVEMQSPYRMFTESWGPMPTVSHYTWLLLATPALLAFFAYRVLRERAADKLYFAVAATFGLFLLLQQFRLHYFGFFALVTGAALVIDSVRARLRWHRGATFAGALALFAAAYQPALRGRLFAVYAPAAYPTTLALFRSIST